MESCNFYDPAIITVSWKRIGRFSSRETSATSRIIKWLMVKPIVYAFRGQFERGSTIEVMNRENTLTLYYLQSIISLVIISN